MFSTVGSFRCQSTSRHGTRCCFLAQPYLNHIQKTQLRTDMPRRQTKKTENTQDSNDALTLLRLQQHVLQLTTAKAALEDIQTLVHETTLSNFTSAQDRRTLNTAQCCLNSLRIRVEAHVNSVEEAVKQRQLSLSQQLRKELSRTSATPEEMLLVDQELLDGTTIDFKRSLVRLAWILQHAATLLPMAGDLQAVLNSETAGISSIHSWGLMLPSSSRVSPVTYHAVVAVRYPNLCRLVNEMWELGSFASGGLPDRPPGFQLVLWDTDSKITGLVAADLETIVGHIIPDFSGNVEFADGLFVMTTATDHENNLNRSGLKRDNARQLRVETIANSAGGTAQVAIVAQPSTGFLNGRFYADKSPTEDTEDRLGRITVGLTRSKSLTVLVSPLDMLGLMGSMAQVVATIAYGIRGLRRGETTWTWPAFHNDPVQENLGQLTRWSLNQAPDWTYPPLAIANQYRDRHTKEIKRERYRLILVRGFELDWLRKDLLRETRQGCEQGHNWIPKQDLPFTEIVLMPMQRTVHHTQHMYCCPQDCIKPVPAKRCHKLDPPEKLSRCRAYISSMAGVLTPP